MKVFKYAINAHLYQMQICLSLLDGDARCSLEEVLVFFSGTSSVPPLGFPHKPYLSFLSNDAALATASTCELALRIPTCHVGYNGFLEWMELSILSHEFFEQ